MADNFFFTLLNIIKKILNVLLTPIYDLIATIIPGSDLATILGFFDRIKPVVLGPVSFIAHLLPPNFRGILGMFIYFVFCYYTAYLVYVVAKRLWEIISKIKFW